MEKNPSELNRRPVASLWIGERLHYLNQLCLASHVRHGHPVTLYCTHDVPNAPEGVETRPASDIWDIDMTLVDGTSPAFVANVWRCRMIQQTGAIWVDCDAFCHAPFPDDWDYIFGEHGFRGALNNGVLGMPSDSELLAALLDYYENLPDYPPWWNPRQRKKMDRQDAKLPLAERIYKTERTGFGPQALTHFAKETGVFDRRKPHEVLYPVPFQLNDIFYDPHGRVEGWFTDSTVSVHLYTNGTKPWWRKNAPLENSYAWRMAQEVGIRPEDALED